jgi:hypothetical protein
MHCLNRSAIRRVQFYCGFTPAIKHYNYILSFDKFIFFRLLYDVLIFITPLSMKTPFLDNNDLSQIRRTADWRKLFQALQLERDEKKSKTDDWWAQSPLTAENSASFHINDKGWFCFSSHEGGGIIELVQKVFQARAGQVLNCFEAGQWLLDQGISSLPSSACSNSPKLPESSEKKKKTERIENPPIRQNLFPSLTFDHTEFERRGITAKTASYLGFGYLPPKKSQSRLAGRIVFQVRGVRDDGKNGLKSVVLTHMGRATYPAQEAADGKWNHYAGFKKSLELYNLDKVLLDEEVAHMVKEIGHVLVVEGCWDVAKLIETDQISNVVATFGAHLSDDQIPRFELIASRLGVKHFRFLYDRDRAGQEGQAKAIGKLRKAGFEADGFNWEQSLPSSSRGPITIPEDIQDVCEFKVEQLKWLRLKRYI